MKWICVYCYKIMDKSNFVDFIKDSDNGVYHEWKSLITDYYDHHHYQTSSIPELQGQTETIEQVIV